MSSYSAEVRWFRGAQPFTDNKYSRAHKWRFDGGIEVPASSSPSVVPVPLSSREAVDPEEAFVASLSSCHMLWFLFLAAKRGFRVDDYADHATGEVSKNAEGKIAMTKVTLHPQVTFSGDRVPDEQGQHQLHDAAHEQCFLANSVKTEVLCEPVFPAKTT